jgi:O-glycosyl hydrolase
MADHYCRRPNKKLNDLTSSMKMTRHRGLGLLLTLILAAAGDPFPAFAGTGSPGGILRLEVDRAKPCQVIDGFGASDAWRLQMIGKYWPEPKRNEIADLLFSSRISDSGKPVGIGLSIWRFYIGSGSLEQGAESGIRDEWRRAECFQLPDGTYDWTKQEGQQWFLKAARARGVPRFLAFSIAAPAHLALNGKAHGTGTNVMNIQPGKLDDYAKFLVDVVEHFDKKEKISFQYLSPINEPQWDWGTRNNQEGTAASNAECYEFVRLLGAELHRRGLKTQVAFGEAGSIVYLYSDGGLPQRGNQIREFFSPNAKHFIDGIPNVANLISGHSYHTTWPVDALIKHRVALRKKLDEVSPQTAYWQSEFCILEKTEEIGAGWRRDLTIDTALYVARVIHADMTIAGATSWQWWTAVTRFDYKDGLVYVDDGKSTGLRSPRPDYTKHDGEIRASKLLWALGNYSLFVRPGMVRIPAGFENRRQSLAEQARDLMVSAYLDPGSGRQVIVFVNYSREERTVAVPGAKPSRMETFITSAERDLEKVPVTGSAVSIPARSVVTVVLQSE